MPFQLQVEFSGLCLFVQNPMQDAGGPVVDAAGRPVVDRVAVVMPDCRRQTNPVLAHDDGKAAEPHAGYVRLDLADLAGAPAGVPAGTATRGPRYELVHRFDRQALDFGGGLQAGPMAIDLAYPDVQDFAPNLDLIDGLFTTRPSSKLLMRTVLRGGSLVGRETPQAWKIPGLFRPGRSDLTRRFASFATWTRTVADGSLVLRVTDFRGVEEARFELRPRVPGGTVLLKVANLCAHNPLEWNDLKLRKVFDKDEDFKWMYRLLKPRDGSTYPQILNAEEFPHPERTGASQESGSDDCIGAKIVAAFRDPG